LTRSIASFNAAALPGLPPTRWKGSMLGCCSAKASMISRVRSVERSLTGMIVCLVQRLHDVGDYGLFVVSGDQNRDRRPDRGF
jgi:hypothetical protein